MVVGALLLMQNNKTPGFGIVKFRMPPYSSHHEKIEANLRTERHSSFSFVQWGAMQLYMLSGHDKTSEVFNFLQFLRELSHQQQK